MLKRCGGFHDGKTLAVPVDFSNGLPKHVRVKQSKGYTYYYYDTGKPNASGKPILRKLPSPTSPKFRDAVEEAALIRWRYSTQVAQPIRVGKRPSADDFDASALGNQDTNAEGDHLYFIRAGDFVKIGRAQNVFRRMDSMQANCPLALDCIGTLVGRGCDERHWHAYFSNQWVRGEWFEWTPAVACAVELAKRGLPWWNEPTQPTPRCRARATLNQKDTSHE